METMKQFIEKITSDLQDIKERKLKDNDYIDAVCAVMKSIAEANLSQLTLIKMQVLFKKVVELTKSDFYSFLNSLQKEAEEKKKEKERLELENKLKEQKATLSEIHKLHDLISSSSDDLIEVVLATMMSVRVAIARKLPVIWVIIAGAPSGDKTEHATAAAQIPQVHQIDTLTPAGLASGFVDPKTGQKATKDFLLELDRGILVIKDMASLFSCHHATVQKVLGDLTNIYDGQFKKLTGTSGMVGGDSVFSMVCATTTQSLNQHHRYMAALGPRFFTYRMDRCSHEQIEQGIELIWNGRRAELKPKYKEIFSAYLYKLLTTSEEKIRAIQVPSERQKNIEDLAVFLCKLRSYSSSWKEKDETTDQANTYYNIQIEEPFRALQQLICLAISFALIHGQSEVSEHDIEMMRRLVLGSGPADRVEVLGLFRKPTVVDANKSISVKDCAAAINRSYNRASDLLHELVEIGILEIVTVNAGPEHLFTEKFRFAPEKTFYDILTKPINEIDHTKVGIVS